MRRLMRRFGGFTLFIVGGATSIDSDSRTPREEALIAIAGPATSLAIFLGVIVPTILVLLTAVLLFRVLT